LVDFIILLNRLVDAAIQLLTLLVIVRVLLTWIPSIDYGHPLLRLIARITDPILLPVRRILPPMGGLDLSPIIAILLLNLAGNLLHRFLVALLAAG
jgi:YggT family protein